MKEGDFLEDKKKICDLFLITLQATRRYSDLEALNYEKTPNGEEVVTAIFEKGGRKTVNVSMDSGIAMIKDIINGLAV